MVLSILACNVLAPRPIPTPAPPTPTSTPIPLSKQVSLVSQASNETNQTPPFTITAETPQLAGSDDPARLLVQSASCFQTLSSKEVDVWRQSFLQNTAPVMNNGSTLNVKYTLLSQIDDLWSFKFDFAFYSDGAAHPGLNSIQL